MAADQTRPYPHPIFTVQYFRDKVTALLAKTRTQGGDQRRAA